MARMLSQLPLPLLPPGRPRSPPASAFSLVRTAGWSRCTGWPPSRGMPGMRRAGGWRRCSWSGCGPRRRARWRRRSGWTRARSGGGTRRWPRAGWPGWSRPAAGPKGASKLTPQLAERIAGLDAAGATLREIAAATGVSTFSVRNALGRVASRGQSAAAGAAAAPAWTPGTVRRARARRFRCCRTRCPGTGSGCWPGGGCWARAPPRCSPRARGIRWPGCCWRCRRWRTPACWTPPARSTAGSRTGSTG